MKILMKNFVCLTITTLSCLFLSFSLIVHPASALSSEPPIIAGKTQMTCGETQVLSIMNYLSGNTYTWTIKSGGGTLSSSTGERVTYAAPTSNPNGENNPTIIVDCNGEEAGSLQIAVNAVTSNQAAYVETDDWDTPNRCDGTAKKCGSDTCVAYCLRWRDYRCDGVLLKEHTCEVREACDPNISNRCLDDTCEPTSYTFYPIGYCLDWCEGSKEPGTTQDVRTEAMKAAGCCPEALLAGYEPKPAIPKDTDHGKTPGANEPVRNPASVADPINIYNGNTIESEEDLRFASPNRRGLFFKRFYNSQSKRTRPLGYGWIHTYDIVLNPSYALEGSTYLRFIDETGRGVYFEDAGSGHYVGAFKERTTVEVVEGNYIWYRLDGSRFAFNAQGKLIWIEDEVGNRQNLTYNASNRLETVTDEASGRVLTFHYNAYNRLDNISGPVTPAVPDGIWVRYGYDDNQNLVSVTYADGSGFDYIYGDPNDVHNLTEKHDKMGHLLSTWIYDAQDRAIESFTRDGRGVSINYVSENEVKVADAYGVIRTYRTWDIDGRKRVTDIEGPPECPNCGQEVVRLEYDSALRVIEVEYANGLINQYDDFDTRGNAWTVTLGVGTPDEKTITYAFHPEINAKLSQTEASVLGAGKKVVIWDYDDDGDNIPNENPTKLLSRKIERGFTKDISGGVIPYEYITTYTYNSKRQILTIDGPQAGNQDTTTFTYDTATGDLLTVTRPLIGATTYSRYDSAGQGGRVADPNSNALTYTYDGKGRIKTMANESDGSATTYNYNYAGDLESVTDADGIIFDFIYDGTYGRLTQVVDPLGNNIRYDYDAQGNRTELSYFTSSDERVYWKGYSFQGPTQPGKLWRVINPDNTYTEYSYDTEGNLSSVEDAAGQISVYDYDVLKRLTTVTQPGNVITTYAYDRHDNLATVTDAENHTTSFVYDDLGRLVSTTSPDTNTTSYTYDAAGNLISKTDANSNTINYTYDVLNRLTAIRFPDAALDITYTYDEGANGKSRLTGMTDPSGGVTYEYDSRGRLIRETRTIDGNAFTVEYTYSAAGRLLGITYPGGRKVSYHLDGAGKVMRVTSSFDTEETTLADNVAHLPFGPVTAMSLGNGLSVTESFDQLYQLQTSQTGSIYNRTYAYDPVGNVAGIEDLIDPARGQSFEYDALNRLVTASGIYGTISYTYDQVGNRLTKAHEGATTDTYSYVSGTNKLLEISSATPIALTYDANGNTTGMGDKSFLYNQNNRLIEAAESNTTVGEYVYNALGHRAVKHVSGRTTIFLYNQQGNLIAEADKDGEIVNEYVYLDGRLLAGVKSAIEMVASTIDIDPDTLNLESKGRWITCYIELPEGCDVEDIDPATVVLEGSVYAQLRPTDVGDHDSDGIPDLMVKFDRSWVAELLEPAEEATVTVDGTVGGIPFSGTDTIRVIDKGKKPENGTSPVYAASETRQQAEGLYYYHPDHLGTPQVMTDENGDVVWQADYLPFGEAGVVGIVENNFRFTGQYYDQETGLHYNYFRYYHSTIGRYLRPDPIGLEGGVNLYAYAQNNPILFFDPWGLCAGKSVWDKVVEGRYIGAGYGEESVEWYAKKSIEAHTWYEETLYAAGGTVAALWTPETWYKTGATLAAGVYLGMQDPRKLEAIVRITMHLYTKEPIPPTYPVPTSPPPITMPLP